MNAFAGIRPNFPRGSKPDPLAFFPWRLQWGLSVFQWGSNPPPIFTLSALSHRDRLSVCPSACNALELWLNFLVRNSNDNYASIRRSEYCKPESAKQRWAGSKFRSVVSPQFHSNISGRRVASCWPREATEKATSMNYPYPHYNETTYISVLCYF